MQIWECQQCNQEIQLNFSCCYAYSTAVVFRWQALHGGLPFILSSCTVHRYGAVYTLITVQRSVLDSISRTSGELSCLCPLSSSYTPCLPLSHLRLFVCILSCRQSRSGGEFFRPRIVYFAPARQVVEGPCLGREGIAGRLSRRKAWIGRLTHGNCNH